MICPLTRKASFTYSTASTIPEKSFLIIDLDSTIVVFTGRAVVVVVSFSVRSQQARLQPLGRIQISFSYTTLMFRGFALINSE